MIRGSGLVKAVIVAALLLPAQLYGQDTVTVSFKGGYIQLPAVIVVHPDTVRDTIPVDVPCPECPPPPAWTCPDGWTCLPPGDVVPLPVDTLLYVPHVTAYQAGVNPDSTIQRYAQAPVGDGAILHADSGRSRIDAYIRLERRDGAWEVAHGPLPRDTTEASGSHSVRIAGVDSVRFWLDTKYANREGAWPYEMFPGGSHAPIPLALGPHTIRYRVFGTKPEDRTITVIVKARP